MGKIEEALERFNLNYNFTDDELKKAYNEKSKVIEVDFINKQKNWMRMCVSADFINIIH